MFAPIVRMSSTCDENRSILAWLWRRYPQVRNVVTSRSRSEDGSSSFSSRAWAARAVELVPRKKLEARFENAVRIRKRRRQNNDSTAGFGLAPGNRNTLNELRNRERRPQLVNLYRLKSQVEFQRDPLIWMKRFSAAICEVHAGVGNDL